MTGLLLLALTAGMLGAVNPCGFALLPAYLSVLVSSPDGDARRAVGRALSCTLAVTLGYVLVFGTFGLVLTPIAGALQPRLPWLTVVFGLGLAALGGWLLAGRSLPVPPGMRAPVLTGSAGSMVLFGMAYAIASLGCAVGPFLALVVSSLRAGSVGSGLLLFVAYASGMGLVLGVTAVAVALVRVSLIARLRRRLTVVPRLGGAILLVSGLYVAYYGWYELRLAADLRHAGRDPLVNAAGVVQRHLSDWVGAVGVWWPAAVLVLLVSAALAGPRRGRGPVFRLRRSGGRRVGRRRVAGLLGRHQDPQDRVDQDLAARDGQQHDHEQQPGDPGVEAEAAGQAGADAAEHPSLLRTGQTLARHRGVDGVHGVLASFVGVPQASSSRAPQNHPDQP